MAVLLKPADIFLTRGSSFISRAIRFFTQGIGERRTKVNHVGLVVKGGDLKSAIVVEALSRVKRHRLWSRYGPSKKDSVAVYRATNLTQKEIKTIVAEAESQVNKEYGHLMIAAHLLDWLFLGVYFFRRLVPGERYPICSWLVAHSFKKAGKYFNVAPGKASPDDIWDFVEERRPRIYKKIRPLKPLTKR